MTFLEEARAISSELKSIREDLHRHPELGNLENWTSLYIEKILNGLGLEVTHVLNTGLIARLHGAFPGPTIAIRADMDALPVSEMTGCGFESENAGVMHACGHDIHMTSALGCAMLLQKKVSDLHGDVLFVFQPDEEGSGGAQRLIDTGLLCGVNAVFGGHVAPDLPLGTVGIRYGKFYAASDVFYVKVSGVSCHGATPEKGTNSLLAASEMISRLSRIQSSTGDRFVLSVCQFNSGNACNVIAPNAEFSGIIRTLGPENRAEIKTMFKSVVEEVARDYGVEVDVSIRQSYGGIVNTDSETALLEKSALQLFGDCKVRRLENPTMTTEDFGCFTETFSGSFCHFGCGCELPLHSDRFLPSYETAVYASALYAQTVTNYLC